jgi:RimJ/RimL family protein N-acetyltransferase
MSDESDPRPITLEGPRVHLVPLALEHAEDLFETLGHPAVFRYLPVKPPESADDMRGLIGDALDGAEQNGDVPFAIRHLEDNRVVGSTRYIDVHKADRGLEIGWTWVGLDYQRTPVNTECKFLLLKHAFDDLGAFRVQLKTDSRNEKSQASIQRIGAKREGTLRNHTKLWNGYLRHTVMFSITHKEWQNEAGAALRLRML